MYCIIAEGQRWGDEGQTQKKEQAGVYTYTGQA